MSKLAVLLSERNARTLRNPPEAAVAYLLLERTLFDPPRAAAASRWATQLRRMFEGAELLPYVWHLLSHEAGDGLRQHASRELPGSPHAFGGLKDTPEIKQAWTAALPCYRELGASRLVLRTPASITPGAVGRRRISNFVAARAEDGFAVLWEPEGLWEYDDAQRFAAQLGITVLWPAFVAGRPSADPEALAEPHVWLRVDGSSRDPRLSADQLDALLELDETHPEGVFVFAGSRALANVGAFSAEL